MRVETASVVNDSMGDKPRVLSSHEGIQLLQIFRDQVGSCPDYAHIGRGWNYPESRAGYQSSSSRRHASLKQSRDRQARSIRAVDAAINSLETSVMASSADVVRVIGNLILDEAGFHSNAAIRAHASWTANAIEAFVSHMAIHPLRAFVELVLQADEDPTTMSGEPLPRRKIESALMNIIAAIIDGRFPRNRFGTPGDDEDGAAAEKDEQAPTCKEGSERAGEAHERAVNARRMIAGVRDKSRWQGPFVVNMTAAGDKSIVVREVCGSRRKRERERECLTEYTGFFFSSYMYAPTERVCVCVQLRIYVCVCCGPLYFHIRLRTSTFCGRPKLADHLMASTTRHRASFLFCPTQDIKPLLSMPRISLQADQSVGHTFVSSSGLHRHRHHRGCCISSH